MLSLAHFCVDTVTGKRLEDHTAYDKRQRTQNMEEQYDQDCYCGHYTHLDLIVFSFGSRQWSHV